MQKIQREFSLAALGYRLRDEALVAALALAMAATPFWGYALAHGAVTTVRDAVMSKDTCVAGVGSLLKVPSNHWLAKFSCGISGNGPAGVN